MKPPRDINEAMGAGFDHRADILRLLSTGSIGIELGVAEGMLSEKLLRTPILAHLFSVDRWAGDRGHDVSEYKRALHRLLPFKERNTVLRMSFDEALDLFPDNYFDLIYIDGYAHTGQEKGKTLADWWSKLKPGGVFSGDDYAYQWPRTMEVVDQFMDERHLEFFTLSPVTVEDKWSESATWLVLKPHQ